MRNGKLQRLPASEREIPQSAMPFKETVTVGQRTTAGKVTEGRMMKGIEASQRNTFLMQKGAGRRVGEFRWEVTGRSLPSA